MSQIKPGHRLYLYRLFRRELGVGKQTALARAAEVLEADGLAPADLGFDDARSLFEVLSECVKVTVFKKGAVFVTVLANEEYDQALDRAEKNGGKNPAGAKSFKRQRGVKNVKPLKPKHIEPEPEPVPEPEPEPEVEPEIEAAPEPEAAPEVEPKPEPTVAVEEDPAAEPAIEAQAEPEVAAPQEAEPAPEAAPEDEADKELAANPEPKPAPAPEPSIKFTITYAPEPIEQDIDPDPLPEATTDEAPAEEPAATGPAPARPSRPARPANNLPQDFYADVIVTDEPLSAQIGRAHV